MSAPRPDVEPVPTVRLRSCNDRPVRPTGRYVLYWMIAARRSRWSFALQHALWLGAKLGRPVLVLEALRSGYRFASDRLHHFVLDGMNDNAETFARAGVRYYPYVEPDPGHGAGLLQALAERACVVVTDEFPCFFLPRMVAAAASRLDVRLESVDGNGIIPLRASERSFTTAASFRRFLHRGLAEHLARPPLPAPLDGIARLGMAAVPREVSHRWRRASKSLLANGPDRDLASLPIDHDVGRAPFNGGSGAAEATWAAFLEHGLARYDADRNHPDLSATSGLSPYLHFGHISTHQLVADVLTRESWTPSRLAMGEVGRREGFWGVSPAAEAFLDQLVTWRELGFTFTSHHPETYSSYEALPAWARTTLEKHTADERAERYTVEELTAAKTVDPLWNAAQRQLLVEGRLHNYLRMLWGKKILEWSKTPRAALDALIELNDRFAVDGRDPNSYTGILWILGAFDRPWGPERPIFGTVRYMSSANTRRKIKLRRYLEQFGE